MGSQTNTPSLFRLVPFAREQRKNPTRSEALLWEDLRLRRLDGARFRRQHPFALGFVVDFYAPCHRLVVEVDGGVHWLPGAAEYDAARQAAIEETYRPRPPAPLFP